MKTKTKLKLIHGRFIESRKTIEKELNKMEFLIGKMWETLNHGDTQ